MAGTLAAQQFVYSYFIQEQNSTLKEKLIRLQQLWLLTNFFDLYCQLYLIIIVYHLQKISMVSLRQIIKKFMKFYRGWLKGPRNSQNPQEDVDFISEWNSFISESISLILQPSIQGRPNLYYDSKFRDIYNVITSVQLPTQQLKKKARMVLMEKKVLLLIRSIEGDKKQGEIVSEILFKSLKNTRINKKDVQTIEKNLFRCFIDDNQYLYKSRDNIFKYFLQFELKMQIIMRLKNQNPSQLMCSSIFSRIRSACMNDKLEISEESAKKQIRTIDKIMWEHFAVRSIVYEQMKVFLISEQKTQGQSQEKASILIKSQSLTKKRILLKNNQLIKKLIQCIENGNLQEINQNQQNLLQYVYDIKEKQLVNDSELVQEVVFAQNFSNYRKKYSAQVLVSKKTLPQLFEFLKRNETYVLYDKLSLPKIDDTFRSKYYHRKDKEQLNQHIQTQFRLLLSTLSNFDDDLPDITERLRQIDSFLRYLPNQIQPKYEYQFKKHKKQLSNDIEDKLLNQKGQNSNILSLYFLIENDRIDHLQFQLKIMDKFQSLNMQNNLRQWIQFLGLLTSIYNQNDSFYQQIKGQSKLGECLKRITLHFKQKISLVSECLQFTSASKKRYEQLKKNICEIVYIFVRLLSFSSKAISKDYLNKMLSSIIQAFKNYPAKYSIFKKKIQARVSNIKLQELNKSTCKSIMNDRENAKKAFDIINMIDSEMTNIKIELIDSPQQIEQKYIQAFEEILFLKEPITYVNLELTQISKDYVQLKSLVNDGLFKKENICVPNLQIIEKFKKIKNSFINDFLKQHMNEYDCDLINKISKQMLETRARFHQKMEESFQSVKSIDIHSQLLNILQSKYCIFKPEQKIDIYKRIYQYQNKGLKEEIQMLRDTITTKNLDSAHAAPHIDKREVHQSFDVNDVGNQYHLRRQQICDTEDHEQGDQQRSVPDSFLDNQSQTNDFNISPSTDHFYFEQPQEDNTSDDDKVKKTYKKDEMKISFPTYGACPIEEQANNFKTLFFQHLSKLLQQLFKQGQHFQCVNKLYSIRRTNDSIITTEPKGYQKVSIYKGNLSLESRYVLKRINSLKKPELFILCIARGIGELQAKGFFHGDIRFRNIIAIIAGAKIIFKLIDYDKAFLVGQFQEIKSIFQAWLNTGCCQIQIFSFIFGSRYTQVLERLKEIKRNPEQQDKMKHIMKQLRLEMMRSHLQQFECLINQLLDTNKDNIEQSRLNVIRSALTKLKVNTEIKIKRFRENDSLFDMDTYNASSYEQFVQQVTFQSAQ